MSLTGRVNCRTIYFRLEDDKIVVIDTEWRTFDSNKRFKNLSRLIFDTKSSWYDEEAFTFIMHELTKYIPKHKYDGTSNRHPYKKIYGQMKQRLQKESHHFSWDSVGFFNEHFPMSI